jgi:hypothetical protein
MPDAIVPRFTAMAGERRLLSAAIVDEATAIIARVPPGKKGVFIAGVDIKNGQPKAVVMIGQKLNDHWSATFVYTGSKVEGHSVSATLTGSW